MLKKLKTTSLVRNIIACLKIFVSFIFNRRPLTGPYRVAIDIINNCDLGCIMCNSHSYLIEDGNRLPQRWREMSMSWNRLRDFVVDAASIGVRSINICGFGEPFMHPEILSFIEIIKKHGLECGVFTNGIYIDRKKIKFLADIGLDKIILSLHAGDPTTYFKVHPLSDKSLFLGISDWLEYLKEIKRKNNILPKIQLRSVLTKMNYDSIDRFNRFATEKAVNFMEFKIAHLPFEKMEEELSLNKMEISSLISNLKMVKYATNIKNNINPFISTLERRLSYNQNLSGRVTVYPKKRMFCPKPWFSSVILTSGTVVSCPYNSKSMGDISDDKFSNIWFSNKYDYFRKKLYCMPCEAGVFSKCLDLMHRVIFFK